MSVLGNKRLLRRSVRRSVCRALNPTKRLWPLQGMPPSTWSPWTDSGAPGGRGLPKPEALALKGLAV